MTDWLTFTREHIATSYKKLDQQKNCGVFSEPVGDVDDSFFGNTYINFHDLGATFYTAAKLLDDYRLIEIMDKYRFNCEVTDRFTYDKLGDIQLQFAPTKDQREDLIAAVQYEHLLRLFNQRRVNAERFITTNMRHATELCLKALAAVANNRLDKRYTFPWTHSLIAIYEKLPKDLRREIEAELPKFADAYAKQAQEMTAMRRQICEGGTLVSISKSREFVINHVVALLNNNSYTSFENNEPDSLNVDGQWLVEALRKGPSFDDHRYGPKQGPDEYPSVWVNNALILGRFFYEHLFPVSIIRRYEVGPSRLREWKDIRGH